MVKRSLPSVGVGLGSGWIISAMVGLPSLANPGSFVPPPPPVEAVNREAATATYQRRYQDYSQLLGQVTSIHQFRDVSPSQWSYAALQNLVDNYGCLVGYPDRTYRGDRPLTRHEFAAGLSACLTQLEQRLMAAKQQLEIVSPPPPPPPANRLETVFNRAFYHTTGRFYDLTSVSGQANKIFGWRSWPGSYMDNMIAEDAAVVEAIYNDALEQQTQGTVIQTQDLPEPFNESLLDQPSYVRFGNPPLPPQPPLRSGR
ncbi:MAG: hypothetical protein RLZZ568_783 [Cyanobacteriota bacterium]|jgi:hypothetical protein